MIISLKSARTLFMILWGYGLKLCMRRENNKTVQFRGYFEPISRCEREKLLPFRLEFCAVLCHAFSIFNLLILSKSFTSWLETRVAQQQQRVTLYSLKVLKRVGKAYNKWLVFESVRKCSKVFESVQKCSKVFKSVQKQCSKSSVPKVVFQKCGLNRSENVA